MDYKNKKALSIGAVRDLTGLTLRQIRYYEERKLIHPERTEGGTRQYSFLDVETLVSISNKMKDGSSTFEIKKENKPSTRNTSKQVMILGQLNAHFHKK